MKPVVVLGAGKDELDLDLDVDRLGESAEADTGVVALDRLRDLSGVLVRGMNVHSWASFVLASPLFVAYSSCLALHCLLAAA